MLYESYPLRNFVIRVKLYNRRLYIVTVYEAPDARNTIPMFGLYVCYS